MNALLILPAVLTFALVDAPRSAALLQQPAPVVHEATPVGHQATPIVESPAPEGTPVVEQPTAMPVPEQATATEGTTAPSAAGLAASPLFGQTVLDVNPGRVWLGGVVGGLGVLVGIVAGAGAASSMSLGTSDVAGWAKLIKIVVFGIVGGWVVGPVAASLAMGGYRVPLRVLGYAFIGLLVGVVSAVVPVVGIFTFLAGPTIGAVYAVASSPANAAGEPVSLRSSATGPLLSFSF